MNAHFFSGLRLPLVWRRQLSPLRAGEAGRRFLTRLVPSATAREHDAVPLRGGWDVGANQDHPLAHRAVADASRAVSRFHHAGGADDVLRAELRTGGRVDDRRTALPQPGPADLRPEALGDLRRWARR